MTEDDEKLAGLFEMLNSMEDDVPKNDAKSRDLISNLNILNSRSQFGMKGKELENPAEQQIAMLAALVALKKTIESIKLDFDEENAQEIGMLKTRIDEFLETFTRLRKEDSSIYNAELNDSIKEFIQDIDVDILH